MFRSGITSGGGTAGVASSILVFVVRVRVLRVNLRGGSAACVSVTGSINSVLMCSCVVRARVVAELM